MLLLWHGAGTQAPIPPAVGPYVGDTTIYDQSGATGSIIGGTLQASDTTYDQSGATGSTTSATILPPESTR